jgi:tetratricopeptide (TPR) repeat protein
MQRSVILAAAALLVACVPAAAIDFASPGADIRARNEFAIGVDLVNHQKYLDATPHLETALEQFPDDTDILKYLGFAHRMIARQYSGTSHAGELRLSNTYYRRALDVDPDRKDFLEYMGELYLEMDDVTAAKEKLVALEKHCPNGCAEHDTLAAAIAAYRPPPPDTVPAPGELAPTPTE